MLLYNSYTAYIQRFELYSIAVNIRPRRRGTRRIEFQVIILLC